MPGHRGRLLLTKSLAKVASQPKSSETYYCFKCKILSTNENLRPIAQTLVFSLTLKSSSISATSKMRKDDIILSKVLFLVIFYDS